MIFAGAESVFAYLQKSRVLGVLLIISTGWSYRSVGPRIHSPFFLIAITCFFFSSFSSFFAESLVVDGNYKG